MKAPGGEWTATTPEEFLTCYGETFGTGGSTLAADLRADPKVLHISLELNHRFVDGLHVGRFHQELTKLIEAL